MSTTDEAEVEKEVAGGRTAEYAAAIAEVVAAAPPLTAEQAAILRAAGLGRRLPHREPAAH